MLGSMGIRTILSLVLGLMVLGTLVSFSTVGSIGGAIQQGFDQITDQTDFTTDVDDVETLSDLTLFVRDRAMNEGCKIVKEKNSGGGYEGLKGTRLTQTPECFGADASIIRGQDAITADDNYMPGIYSREKFEVKDTVKIDTINGNTWLEGDKGVIGVKSGSPEYIDIKWDPSNNKLKFEESVEEINTFLYGDFIGDQMGYLADEATGSETYAAEVIVFFEDGSVTERTNLDETAEPSENKDVILQFCEGDKGYVQSNRGDIDDDSGTSSEEPLFPIIVIEEAGDNCGDVGGRSTLVPEETKISGRMLHVASDTTRDYPFLISHLNPGTGLGDITDYTFNFKNLNENQDIDRTVFGENIEFNFDPERSNKCMIGMYDNSPLNYGKTGWVAVDQGHKIDYDDSFPEKDHSDVSDYDLEHGESRPPGQTPRSARELYDRFADDYSGEGGFNTGWSSWEASSTELLYNDFAGEEQFAPYGDILCGEHDNNENFDNEHSKWYMCSSTMIGNEIEAGGDTWTCNSGGEWTSSNINNPSCESDEKICNKNTEHAYCSDTDIPCLK